MIKKSSTGFSLVEVTFAIGIVAFAFIAVFGLVPMGLSTFRKAVDASISAQISQRILNDLQQADFEHVVSSAGSSFQRYFDGDGAEVRPTNPSEPSSEERSRIVYWANVRIQPRTTFPYGAEDLENWAENAKVSTITVQIANNPGNIPITADADLLWKDSRFSFATYSTFLARNR